MTNQINFLKLASELSHIDDFTVEIINGYPTTMPDFENDIKEILPEFGLDPNEFTFPIDFKKQYCLYNGLFLRWSCPRVAEAGFPLMGQFKLPEFVEMMGSSIEYDNKKLFLIDDFFDKWKVYISLGKTDQSHSLYFADLYENAFYPLKLKLGTYYEKLYMCGGLTNWQEFFFSDSNYESTPGLKNRFKKELNLLFPEISFEKFVGI